MSGRVCPLQGVPFQAEPFLPAQPRPLLHAVWSCVSCHPLTRAVTMPGELFWGWMFHPGLGPGPAVFQLRQKGPWCGRQPNFLVTHSQTPPQPAPLALETLPNLAATSSSLNASPAPLPSAGYPPPCMPSTPQAVRTAGAEGLGKEGLCCRTESSLCVWNPD